MSNRINRSGRRRDPQKNYDGTGALLIAMACIGIPLQLFLMLGVLAGVEGSPLIGLGLSIGIPATVGALLGFLNQRFRNVTLFLLATAMVLLALGSLIFADIIGVFCAALYALGAVPMAAFFAMFVRRMRKYDGPKPYSEEKIKNVFKLILIVPIVLHLGEVAIGPSRDIESLAVSANFPVAIDRVWNQRILETNHQPRGQNWVSDQGPHPKQASGHATLVGDIKTIYYSKGFLKLQVESVEPNRLLRLKVLEQNNLENRALAIQSITLRCQPIGKNETKATLSMEYIPLMTPRWYWRPLEEFFGSLIMEETFHAWGQSLRTNENKPAEEKSKP